MSWCCLLGVVGLLDASISSAAAGEDRFHQAGDDVVDVPGHGHALRDRASRAEALNVARHGRCGVEDRVLPQGRLVDADPLGVAATERRVGERSASALRVVDDRNLEQRAVRQDVLGDPADERHVVDYLWSRTTAHVADNDRVAEGEAEKVGRINARVEARDYEQAQPRKYDGALLPPSAWKMRLRSSAGRTLVDISRRSLACMAEFDSFEGRVGVRS